MKLYGSYNNMAGGGDQPTYRVWANGTSILKSFDAIGQAAEYRAIFARSKIFP